MCRGNFAKLVLSEMVLNELSEIPLHNYFTLLRMHAHGRPGFRGYSLTTIALEINDHGI